MSAGAAGAAWALLLVAANQARKVGAAERVELFFGKTFTRPEERRAASRLAAGGGLLLKARQVLLRAAPLRFPRRGENQARPEILAHKSEVGGGPAGAARRVVFI